MGESGNTKKNESTFGDHIIAGSVAGFAECVAVQPFDMMKTRFHLNEGAANPSLYRAMGDVYREGGIMRFYRGILPEIAGMVPKASVMFTTYGTVVRAMEDSNDGVLSTKGAAFAGFLSGYAEALAVTPFQVVKVRLQAKEHLGRYKNTFDCGKHMLRTEGAKSFFKGFGATCWRNCAWNTVYFALLCQLSAPKEKDSEDGEDHARLLVTGTGCGLVATCFNAPFDNVKSRIQSQLPGPYDTLKYKNTLQSLFVVAREEGLKACYKGFVPKAVRMALGGGVSIVAYRHTINALKSDNGNAQTDV